MYNYPRASDRNPACYIYLPAAYLRLYLTRSENTGRGAYPLRILQNRMS
jgi:hypothetical protein